MLKNMLLLLVGQFKMVLLLPINSCGKVIECGGKMMLLLLLFSKMDD